MEKKSFLVRGIFTALQGHIMKAEVASCWAGTGVSEGLFGLILIRAPPGVTATCDITLSACFTRLQTLRAAQRYLSAMAFSGSGFKQG